MEDKTERPSKRFYPDYDQYFTRLPLQELRKKVERDYSFMEDPLQKRYEIEWKILTTMQPDQITRAAIRSYLEAAEPYFKEKAIRALNQYGGNATSQYNMWESASLALDGLNGKDNISKTVEYFRQDAAMWKQSAIGNSKILTEGGPFQSQDIVTESKILQEQRNIWDKISENLNTAARILENPVPNLVVAETNQQ